MRAINCRLSVVFLAAVLARGESLSGYYRFMTQFGYFVWVQTRASVMYDSRTGKPSYMVFLNYIIRFVRVFSFLAGSLVGVNPYTWNSIYATTSKSSVYLQLPFRGEGWGRGGKG